MLGQPAPGEVRLCLSTAASGECASPLPSSWLSPQLSGDWPAHYLELARVVYPDGPAKPPLLLVQTASVHSGDGDQVIYTQLFAYRRATDRFEQVFSHETGHNNNQEVRFIGSGPLTGAVIAAEPTGDRPYRFWITVSRLTPAYAYKQVLRYRSATGYGDGNQLAVIDSEMANIESRLGLWRAGQPLPLPASPCPKPRLTRMELWCQ